MWVVKLGGSLSAAPNLPQWLELLAQVGGGRVTIVPGGGGLANEVRRLQAHWEFDDLPAHNMAVLAMAQNAWMMQGMQPSLQLVSKEGDIPRALRSGKALIWAPLELVRPQADENTNWEVTGDSIALGLALRLNAERLLVIKHCEVDGEHSLGDLVHDEVLDRRFDRLAQQAAFPINVLGCSQLEQARSLLLGESGTIRA
jgi:5-(aminomethyl)-3-furanmethanol phosphate kinase